MELKSAVVFAILMEDGQGIIGKGPGQIMEKLRSCEAISEREYLRCLLNVENFAKLEDWEKRWEQEKIGGNNV